MNQRKIIKFSGDVLYTSKDISIMKMAKSESEKSDFDKYPTGCVVVYKGSVISVGHNTNKTHTTQEYYNKYRFPEIDTKSYVIAKMHAEVNALNKVKYLDIDFSKVKIYIYRKCKSRPYGIARPCKACMQMIRDLGIRKIYYSTDDSMIYEEII